MGSILITFITLPVEFNASKRALSQLKQLGLVSTNGHDAAEQVLKAAAMTYVAGVATDMEFEAKPQQKGLFEQAKALLRAGRFDRQVEVPLPTEKGQRLVALPRPTDHRQRSHSGRLRLELAALRPRGTLAGGLLARQPAGYTVGIVARDLGRIIPCALVQLTGRFPALDDHSKDGGFVWFLSTAPDEALMSFPGHPIAEDNLPGRLGSIALDEAVTHTLNHGRRGRVALYADRDGGGMLLEWYRRQGMGYSAAGGEGAFRVSDHRHPPTRRGLPVAGLGIVPRARPCVSPSTHWSTIRGTSRAADTGRGCAG